MKVRLSLLAAIVSCFWTNIYVQNQSICSNSTSSESIDKARAIEEYEKANENTRSRYFTTTIDTDVPQTTSEGYIYIQICQGQSITFTASNTFHDNDSNEHSDENLTYDWIIITGRYDTIVLHDAGQQISRTFDTSGGFRVKCQTHDTHNTTNSNDNTINVLVSTTPQLEVSANLDTICSGTEIALTGIVHPQKWYSQMPTPNSYSGTDLIPEYGEYSSSIEVHAQDTLTAINSTDQIDNIYINIVHSYFGDLSIMLECPNGQKCLLKAFSNTNPTPMDWSLTGGIQLNGSQGGGRLHLGLSTTTSSSDSCYMIPGEGWTYSIYPDGTIPFGYSSPYHTINYTDNCNNTNNINVVDTAPQNGQYGPYESMSSLIGCPINGTWKLYINDKMYGDNGYLFKWGICMYETPAGWSFENTYQNGLSWNGNGITPDTNGNGAAIAIPSATNTGQQEYTFTCTDNFGCSYDTTINVYVYRTTPVPEIKYVSTNILNQNVLEFVPDNDEHITQYNIYRNSELVATLAQNTSIWTDMTANPSTTIYNYYVTTNDNCGESEMSSHHKTMKLTVSRYGNNIAYLNWTNYEGFEYDTYKIYRGENPLAMEKIGEITRDQNSFTDSTSNGNYYYQIRITNANNSNIVVQSNTVYPNENTINEYSIADFSVYPNPARTTLNISSSETLSSIKICSATGQLLLQMDVNDTNVTCDINHLSSGLYFVIARDGNGKISMAKFTKE